MFNHNNLPNIKRDFKLKQKGLSLEEFIGIMLHYITEYPDKVQLVQGLKDLFD